MPLMSTQSKNKVSTRRVHHKRKRSDKKRIGATKGMESGGSEQRGTFGVLDMSMSSKAEDILTYHSYSL